MSRIATCIAATFLIANLVLAGGSASTAVLPPHSRDESGQAVHTAYWPLIQIQSIIKSRSPGPPPGLQDTGGGRLGIPASGAPAIPEPEQALAGVELPERIAHEVYVQGEFILPVAQQPAGENDYVSADPSVITQFGMAARSGVTGLLAHNYLSGALFYQLDIGQQINVLYADRQIRHYRISRILSFQKLHPADPHSDYVDLQTGRILSTSDVFRKVYRGAHHLTLQTCLEQNGNLSWGLYFVIAIPVAGKSG